LQQSGCESLLVETAIHEEADRRPHRDIIDAGEGVVFHE
jgi:hypothetical protein